MEIRKNTDVSEVNALCRRIEQEHGMTAMEALAHAEGVDLPEGATIAMATELAGLDNDTELVDALEAEGYFKKEHER